MVPQLLQSIGAPTRMSDFIRVGCRMIARWLTMIHLVYEEIAKKMQKYARSIYATLHVRGHTCQEEEQLLFQLHLIRSDEV